VLHRDRSFEQRDVIEKKVWGYLKENRVMVRSLLRMVLLTAILLPLTTTTLRAMFMEKLQLSSAGFGWIMSCAGVGSLVGSLCFFIFKPANPSRTFFPASGLVLLGLMLACWSPSQWSAGFSMLLLSMALFLGIAGCSIHIQVNVSANMRPAIMSLIGINFQSLAPSFAYPLGLVSDSMDSAFVVMGVCCIFVILVCFLEWMYARSSRAMEMQRHENRMVS
jgi:MFS family permease